MSAESIVYDFERFSSRDYLSEYYSEIGSENAFLLEFFHETHSRRGKVKRLLEVGGGPTVYQLISACKTTEEIVFSEYLAGNRREIELWRDEDPAAFNWDVYFEYVLGLEGESTPALLAERKDELRHKIRQIVPYDAKSPTPLREATGPFDLVAVNFCLESITSSEEEYRESFRTMTDLLAPGGLLVMVALKNASFYQVGELNFPAFPVDEPALNRYLNDLAYESPEIRSIPAEHSQGYEGMIALTARKGS